MHIRLGDFTFHGGDLPSLTGFTVGSFTGWLGGPGVKRDNTSRAGAVGAFSVRGHSADRVVSWRGLYHGSSVDDVLHKGDALSGLESLQARATVAWPDTKWADVHVDRVRFEPLAGLRMAEYQVELWLPDPYRYGGVQTTVSAGNSTTYGNIVAAFHRGNAPATPQFTVKATTNIGAAGYEIKGKNRTFQVPGPLNVGQTDLVDFASGTVRRNGSIVTGVVPRMFTVNGGESVDWRLWPLSGAGTATMHLTDTYL